MNPLFDFLARVVLMLRSFFTFDPPDVNDPDALRAWLLDVCRLVLPIAGITRTKVDDQVVKLAKLLIANDETWSALYDLIREFLPAREGVALTGQEPGVRRLADVSGIDPQTIILILTMILKFLEMFFNKEPGPAPSPAL